MDRASLPQNPMRARLNAASTEMTIDTTTVSTVTTTEFMGGVAHKVTAKFRAYDSYEAAFKDHAKLLTQSPRYSQTVAQADTASGFAHGLQKAGYATDPAYADKLTKVINTTLRLQKTVT